jgi:hypothetical protein
VTVEEKQAIAKFVGTAMRLELTRPMRSFAEASHEVERQVRMFLDAMDEEVNHGERDLLRELPEDQAS